MLQDINEHSVKFIRQISIVLYSYITVFKYSVTVFQSKFTKAFVRLLCSSAVHCLPHVKDSPSRKLRVKISTDIHNMFCRSQMERRGVDFLIL